MDHNDESILMNYFRMNEMKQAQGLQQHDQAMRHGHDLKNIRINPLRKVFKSRFLIG